MKIRWYGSLLDQQVGEIPVLGPKRLDPGRRLGIGTIDTTAKGIRCQAAQDITVSGGMVKSLALGTIVFELVGLGCHLVNVYWDQGIDTLVSPEDIVVAETGIVWH
jgi:hypothetical protein